MFNTEILYQFIRGDLPTAEFEQWLYENKDFEQFAGNAFYLEVISHDYSDIKQLPTIKEILKQFLIEKYPSNCHCVFLQDLTILDHGSDDYCTHNQTIKQVQQHPDLWWLSLEQCSLCNQYWLIGQDSRIHDINLLKRIEGPIADKIIKDNQWPEDFNTFEKLLRMGKLHNRSCRFDDPFSYSLVITAYDLKLARPDITLLEIVHLLSLQNEHHAKELLRARWRIYWKMQFWKDKLLLIAKTLSFARFLSFFSRQL